MTTENFAKFIKEERNRMGLTQTELAAQLHVSTAAVSKWERAKCLPDIAKLDEIAQVLGLSVLEVLQCQRLSCQRDTRDDRDEAESADEIVLSDMAETSADLNAQLTVVYRETVDFAVRQNTVRRRRILGWEMAVILAILFVYWFPMYHMVQVWIPSYFTTGEISKLVFRGTPEDLRAAEEVMELADRACGDLGLNRAEAEEKYGLLSRFCYNKDSYPDVVSEEHSLKLWSARFDLTEGWMWVYYSQEGLDESGEVTTGSWRIPSLWYLQPDESGSWKVTHIKEHP